MKKNVTRFQVAVIYVILLLLIVLAGYCVYRTQLLLGV